MVRFFIVTASLLTRNFQYVFFFSVPEISILTKQRKEDLVHFGSLFPDIVYNDREVINGGMSWRWLVTLLHVWKQRVMNTQLTFSHVCRPGPRPWNGTAHSSGGSSHLYSIVYSRQAQRLASFLVLNCVNLTVDIKHRAQEWLPQREVMRNIPHSLQRSRERTAIVCSQVSDIWVKF